MKSMWFREKGSWLKKATYVSGSELESESVSLNIAPQLEPSQAAEPNKVTASVYAH